MKLHLKCGAGVGWVSSFYCHWHIRHVSNSNIGLKIEVKIPMLGCCSNQGSYTLRERKYGRERVTVRVESAQSFVLGNLVDSVYFFPQQFSH